jgi:hypothetical protein
MVSRNERLTFAPDVLPVTAPLNTLVMPPNSTLNCAKVPVTVVPSWVSVIYNDPLWVQAPVTLAAVGVGVGVGEGVGVGAGVWVEATGDAAVGDVPPPPQLAAMTQVSKMIPNRENWVMPN